MFIKISWVSKKICFTTPKKKERRKKKKAQTFNDSTEEVRRVCEGNCEDTTGVLYRGHFERDVCVCACGWCNV